MKIFLLFIEYKPLVFFGILFLFLFIILLIIQYFYISYHLKGLCKIIFNDERYFRLPLEPFNSYFISCLPLVFWRETLYLKKGINFKKLYGKEFYYSINQAQLTEMLKRYPSFFYIQYLIFIFGIIWLILGFIAYISVNYIK